MKIVQLKAVAAMVWEMRFERMVSSSQAKRVTKLPYTQIIDKAPSLLVWKNQIIVERRIAVDAFISFNYSL